MGRGWHKLISPYVPKLSNYLCLIVPGRTPAIETIYNSDKPVILWMHNTTYQFGKDERKFLSDPKFHDKLKYLIVVSEFQKQETIKDVGIPAEKIIVIPNAIEALKYEPTKFNRVDKVKLINTSSPDRGIDVLLNSMTFINEDFELDIFSKFNPNEFPYYVPDPRINFYGFSHKSTVRKHYEAAHIHAYPSTYQETFCISQAEAMSAGLLCLTSDLGALPEVSNGFTKTYTPPSDPIEHAKLFAEHLTKAIQEIKSGSFNPTAQIEYVNTTYSWEAIKQKWIKFHELL